MHYVIELELLLHLGIYWRILRKSLVPNFIASTTNPYSFSFYFKIDAWKIIMYNIQFFLRIWRLLVCSIFYNYMKVLFKYADKKK